MRRVIVYKNFRKDEILYRGYFHGFSAGGALCEGEGEIYATAIVEKDDGNVDTPAACEIKFEEPLCQDK